MRSTGVEASAYLPTVHSVSYSSAMTPDRGRPVDAVAPAVAAMMADDAASRALGIELLESGPGTAVTRMTVRPDMVNGHAIAHGGLVFALADTAFACACNSWGPVTVAAAAEVVFIAPARLGDTLIARAALRTPYGRSGIYDVTVTRGDEVIAEFRGRSQQLRDPAGAAP
jgi:acyl-CoA thioesterase